MNIYRYILILMAMSATLMSRGAVDTRPGSYNERVRSVRIEAEGDAMAPPVLVLGADDRLLVSFDVLSDDRDYLRYELVHCNADWQPSGLVDSEFLDGFNLGNIDDYDYAQLTATHYIHYRLAIPNAEVSPKLSGNYLLKIYPEQDPDDIWAQVRFMVSEQTASIDASMTTRTDIDYNVGHQQLALRVDTERSDVVDPLNDLIVKVQQNGRLDNEVTLTHPLRMEGRHRSVYEHTPALIFNAGNEYRRMEVISTVYPGMGVAGIRYREPYYHFSLVTDEPRASQMYLYDQTQHGRYVVREYNSSQSDIEADYVVVHFSLEMPRLEGARVYIDGDMVSRRFDPEAEMTYNPSTGRYERSMLLKQGAYNYQYLAVPDGSERGYTSPIEGDKYETVNEYLIKVYARHPGDRYDRLIGVTQL